MDTFEIVVLSIAIILLILALGAFVYFMTKVDKTTDWPPVVSDCPDFWKTEVGSAGDEDGSRNICVDENNTIDVKCKTFHADASGDTGFETGWDYSNYGEFLLDQKENDFTTHNDFLVYQDSNNDYQYSGYDSDTHSIDAEWSTAYSVDISGTGTNAASAMGQTLLRGSSESWGSDLTGSGKKITSAGGNTGLYTISDGNPVKVSFNLPDADNLTPSQLTEEKKKWARKCNVSWDGITNS